MVADVVWDGMTRCGRFRSYVGARLCERVMLSTVNCLQRVVSVVVLLLTGPPLQYSRGIVVEVVASPCSIRLESDSNQQIQIDSNREVKHTLL